MNISSTISLYGGGPGSGCNPEVGKCGRPETEGYHGTSPKDVRKILTFGLKPGYDKHVWLTNSKEEALLIYAAPKAMGLGKRLGLTTVKQLSEMRLALIAVDVSKLGKEIATGGTLSVRRLVPVAAIKRVEMYRLGDIVTLQNESDGVGIDFSAGIKSGFKPVAVKTINAEDDSMAWLVVDPAFVSGNSIAIRDGKV